MKNKTFEEVISKFIEYVEEEERKCYRTFVDFGETFDNVRRDKFSQRFDKDLNVHLHTLAMIIALLLTIKRAPTRGLIVIDVIHHAC